MELELKANLFTLDGETNGILEKSFLLSELDKKPRGNQTTREPENQRTRETREARGWFSLHRVNFLSTGHSPDHWSFYPICFLKAGLEKEKDDFNRNHVHMGSDH